MTPQGNDAQYVEDAAAGQEGDCWHGWASGFWNARFRLSVRVTSTTNVFTTKSRRVREEPVHDDLLRRALDLPALSCRCAQRLVGGGAHPQMGDVGEIAVDRVKAEVYVSGVVSRIEVVVAGTRLVGVPMACGEGNCGGGAAALRRSQCIGR